MNTFRASNGVVVSLEGPTVSISKGGVEDRIVGVPRVEALREFFRAEEDERLGRWRDPERDSFVVYPQVSAGIVVLCESTGISRVFADLYDVDGFSSSYLSQSAYAYFDAHPEPKPWHKAKTGEVWILEGGHLDIACTVVESNKERWFTRATVFGKVERYELTDPTITSASRIWPEES